MRKRILTTTKRLITILLALFYIVSPQVGAQGYSGLSDKQLNTLGIYFARGNYDCDNKTSAFTGTVPNIPESAGKSGSWSSGLQPPYILEQFMIEVLKDVAKKVGVDEKALVTQDRVQSLIGFAIGEGGDINNQDIFNPLNSGLKADDLTVGGAGGHADDGVQSYVSFDAGVEATARSFLIPTQSRIAQTLLSSDFTQQKFINNLTHFKEFEGNKAWATLSIGDPQAYINNETRFLDQVKKNYTGTAGLVIGTPELEAQTHHTDKTKLMFKSDGTVTTTTTTNTSVNGLDPASAPQACTCNGQGNAVLVNPNDSGPPVILIDPSHSGTQVATTDPATGVADIEGPNQPEMNDAFDVATIVSNQLSKDGYKVITTKQKATDSLTSRQRADIANESKAALALSIHTHVGVQFDSFENYVYAQQNGLYRISSRNGAQVPFNNTTVALGSQAAGEAFADERAGAEGHRVDRAVVAAGTLPNEEVTSGNIWLPQLFANVPWIVNEVGGTSKGGTKKSPNGLSDEDKQKYANGLINGVEHIIAPPNPDACGVATAASTTGTWTATVRAYAWPKPCSAPFFVMTGDKIPSNTSCLKGVSSVPCLANNVCYRQAVQAAQKRIQAGRNDYIGGGAYPGIDCGGFVTRLFRDSGADKNYNEYQSNVQGQYNYMVAHPKLYAHLGVTAGTKHPNKKSDLRKGDIYIQSDKEHTFVFVGDEVWPKANAKATQYDIASASIGPDSWRTPMAGQIYDISDGIWFRPLYPIE